MVALAAKCRPFVLPSHQPTNSRARAAINWNIDGPTVHDLTAVMVPWRSTLKLTVLACRRPHDRPDLPHRAPSVCAFRPFAMADLPAVIALYSEPGVLRYLYVGPRPDDEIAKSLEQRRKKTDPQRRGRQDDPRHRTQGNRACIGEVILVWLSETHKSAEAGFLLHPELPGPRLCSMRPPCRCCNSVSSKWISTASSAAATGATRRQPG